ncbi:hypothetical protein LTR36_003482 [Oleoguttula mirabilis]|uniref:Lytic polysaccharide monooxygenase n=1 Tax=Oleoguttula mirabilis TaxID=1507867 RepID=A0AAV9JJ77_9PEZI|nr:hypothetical protein LTR36_003482 [Oleoguttula mirabilis]
MRTTIALAGALLATHAVAHMQLVYPAPFNASNNPYRTTPADPYLQYPYDCCGPNDRWAYPCRGYLSLLGTPQGEPTATWEAGSAQSWNISGIGNHYGGSCQVGFSTDRGENFRVATSYEGNCPHRNNGDGAEGQDFELTVPSDLEVGVQVFAWIWYNREQEFNMNCAAVNITAPSSPSPSSGYGSAASSSTSVATAAAPTSSGSTYKTANGCTCTCDSPVDIATCTCSCPSTAKRQEEQVHHKRQQTATTTATSAFVAYTDRPLMLVADDGNGCLTPKSTAEVKYPDPGPEVVVGDGLYPLALPSGNCSGVGTQAYDGSTGNDEHP